MFDRLLETAPAAVESFASNVSILLSRFFNTSTPWGINFDSNLFNLISDSFFAF